MSNLILVSLLLCMFFTSGGLGLNVSSCIERERQALLDVKANLTDPHGYLDGWGSKEGEMDCCKWRGVICDSLTGNVIELHFFDWYLNDGCEGVGKISPSLQVLTQLQSLDLSYINFQSNPLPPFLGSLSNLYHLRISSANLCGLIPHQLANLSNLLRLDLSNNSLEGFIPHSFGDLISLTRLDLSRNQLVGVIPKSFENFSSLNTLDLSQNLLSGSLPSFVNCSSLTDMNLADNSLNGSMPDLTRCTNLGSLNVSRNSFNGILPNFMGCPNSLWKLDMSGNQFSGIVPNSLGQLSNLCYLDLSSNSLEGVISEIHFLNLTQLTDLDLSLNSNLTLDLRYHGESPFQLVFVKFQSCKLGPKFPMWIKTQKNISYLDISNAGISDNMPTWFSGLSSLLLFMNLSSNEIKGNLPNMSNIGSVYPNTSSWPRIDLSYNYFEGKVPLLPRKLAALNLSGNRFSGTLSFLCEIGAVLTFLDLSNNSFSGSLPDCWLNFQKTLVVLNLSNNNLSGKIPYSLGFLSRLEAMYLRTNAFVGEVPLLRNCTRLRFLDLWGNKLSGFIPEWIGEALSELYVLDLGSNRFRGRLPSQVCWLHNLQVLDLSDNELSGNILGCFDNFTAMATRNNLSGEDRSFVSSGLQLMKSIDLSRNNLSGEVPHEVTRLYELVSLNLSINKLHGEVPKDIGQLKNLVALDLSENKFSGCIPSSLSKITFLSYLGLSYNYIEGKVPLLPRGLTALNLSGNRFSGTLSFLCEIEEFLTFLDLSNNSFSGSLTDCWLNFQKTLVVLNLSNNNLSGKIPSSLGFLSRLEAMYLRANAFVGEVPLLSNCTRLRFLDLWGNKLSGFIPEWIGEALSELYVLDLGSNSFRGRLPSQVCWLHNLQVLDLSDNELSGNILGCFDNFTAMATKNITNDMSSHSYSLGVKTAQYFDNAWVTWKGKDRSFGRSGLQLMKSIDLSRNNLSGKVPHEITRLLELVSLNLSINKLHGKVPKEIGQLKNLDSLDLSRNNFSGRIPSSLSKITFLSYLDLSFNKFSGRIPTGSQLQSFENAYNGNPQLCGPPLTPECGNSPAVEKKANEEDEDNCWKSYYTGMGSGFAAGFLGICGVIIVNRRCRYVIFASSSYIKDWIYVTVVVYFGKLGRKFRK